MKYKISVPLIIFIVLSLGVSLMLGCGSNPSRGGGTPTHGTYRYLGIQSPGDVWAFTIGPSTFTALNETTLLTIEGHWSALPSGFAKAVVDVSIPSGSVEVGSVLYFLEYATNTLIVKPTGEVDNVIICAGRAAAAPFVPSGTVLHFSGVAVPNQSWEATGEPSYGTIETVQSGSTSNYTAVAYDLSDSFVSSESGSGFTFVDGRYIKDGALSQLFITSTGMFVIDQGSGEGGFAGTFTPASFSSTEVASRAYHGFLFTYDLLSGHGTTEPIAARSNPAVSGQINGFEFVDVETGSLEADAAATLEFTSFDSSKGIVHGNFYEGGTTSDLRIVIAKVSAKYVLFGITQDPSGNPRNILLIQD